MKILHICAGWQKWNGAANIARLIMGEQERQGHVISFSSWTNICDLRSADEVWIHCSWMPCLWWAALWGKNVHWMPEASYDPIRRAYHGWKKTLVGPIERFFLRWASVIVATCEAEKEWIKSYLGKRYPPIEVTDIKRFFDLNHVEKEPLSETKSREPSEASPEGMPQAAANTLNTRNCGELNLLYLGRKHPLKGLEFLEEAVRQIMSTQSSVSSVYSVVNKIDLRVVSNAFGEEKEKVWEWCDVLVLPTLSENFGLVVAEALERGKRVITTDGASAWGECLEFMVESLRFRVSGFGSRVPSSGVGDGEIWSGYDGRLLYLKGYRDGNRDVRVKLLQRAIELVAKIEGVKV